MLKVIKSFLNFKNFDWKYYAILYFGSMILMIPIVAVFPILDYFRIAVINLVTAALITNFSKNYKN